MSKTNVVIVVIVAAGIVGALGFRALSAGSEPQVVQATAEPAPQPSAATEGVPRMVEFGSDTCASCQAMMPVLDELRRRHGGSVVVEFVDVWKNPPAAAKHHIRTIPTQVFFDPDGNELFRHTGFYSVNAIRAKWASLGYALSQASP